MGKTYLDLGEILKQINRECYGVENVYFQPPDNMKMRYPCTVYALEDIRNSNADNFPYKQDTAYSVTIIDKSPISPIVDKVKMLPQCSFDRHYVTDNLNHYVFTIYI